MIALNYSDARAKLRDLMDRAIDERKETVITRKDGSAAVIVSHEDWSSTKETLHLLTSSANAEALRGSIKELESGQTVVKSSEELAAVGKAPTPDGL